MPADDANAPVPIWDVVHQSVVDPRTSNLAVDHAQCMIPGLSSFTHEDVDKIRRALGHARWLGVVVAEASKALNGSSASRSTLFAAQKDARLILVNEELPEFELPFLTLDQRSNKTIAAALSAEGSASCSFTWGPHPGPARDLLSPATMTVMCWLGPRFAQPLLDLAFAFATDIRSFKMAWLNCPAQSELLDMVAVEKRAATLRTSPAVNSPGAAVMHLAKIAEAKLLEIVHAVCHAFESRAFCVEHIKLPEDPINVADMVKSEAIQYRDCTSSAVAQVQSALPTLSSLPDVEPQFDDERSTSWFRTAEYTFKHIKFPSFSGLRGDQLSELRWHKYQSDVLHARAHCNQLSERQVIQHLMSTISRSEQHFALAQQTALQSHCTVRQWLETIRDFYFTNGQFRHNIERAWQSYNAEESADFNELMHHVTEYYRLIFLDYAHMPGKQSRLDFACILFVKLQKLMQPGSTSRVAPTITMFLPLSQLLSKFNDELKPAMNECTEKSDIVATAFIEWAVTQLLRVRESANTVQRYTLEAHDSQFDYARLQAKRRPNNSSSDKPKLQAAAAVMRPSNSNIGSHVQSRQAAQSAFTLRPGHVPFLKDMCNTRDEAALRRWIAELRQLPNVSLTADFTTALDKELTGGDTSLRGALAHATEPLPANMTASVVGCVQLLLRVYFLYRYKQCGLCPPCRENPAAGQHKLCDCPTFRRIIPAEVSQRFFADDFNRTRLCTPMPAGYDPSARQEKVDKPKRDRYDPSRTGPSNKSKRSRPPATTGNDTHIR